MQENVMQFFNTLPLFIGIAISFTFSFNEDTSIELLRNICYNLKL